MCQKKMPCKHKWIFFQFASGWVIFGINKPCYKPSIQRMVKHQQLPHSPPQWELIVTDKILVCCLHPFCINSLSCDCRFVCLCMLITRICVRVFGRMKLNVILSYSVVEKPVPEISHCIVMTDDLLALTEGLVTIFFLKTFKNINVIHKMVTRWHC